MRVVLYMNIPSPHQLPLAAALARLLGRENVRYVSAAPMDDERLKMGWSVGDSAGVAIVGADASEAREWLEAADVMLTGIRDFGLFERRGRRGLKTFYASERWFKPRLGRLRMLLPSYRRMADRFRVLVREGFVTYLPCGVWAARRMASDAAGRRLRLDPDVGVFRRAGGVIRKKASRTRHARTRVARPVGRASACLEKG